MVKVDGDTSVEELLEHNPALSRVFIRFKVPCLVCGEPFWGTVRELADKHDVDLQDLLDALNDELRDEG
jgi:hypothetical protein